MRRLQAAWLGAMMLALLIPAAAFGQRKKQSSARGRLNAGFKKGPEVGAKLPDISAFDANGKAFRLSSLKGSHSVLVFGCLT